MSEAIASKVRVATAKRAIIVGVDGSRNRSGGARAHLVGIIESLDPEKVGIGEVHVWAYQALLDALPDRPWLHKHAPKALECGLLKQLYWQWTALSREAKQVNCDILFATDASTLCDFQPLVVLSQDMLSYEKGVMAYFSYGKARLRLFLILLVQNAAFRRARGVMFLTSYAAKVIQSSCGQLDRTAIVPHGVGEQYKRIRRNHAWPGHGPDSIVCTYVSNAEMYKHQWQVVEAFAILRARGHNVRLILVGGGAGQAQQLLDEAMTRLDPSGQFVTQVEFVSQEELVRYLEKSDLFVFASSCENQPVTLLEGMAAGLPIACSNRGPMPEVLGDAGVYFDPEAPLSIADAVAELIRDGAKRDALAERARQRAADYSWSRCSEQTFNFIANVYWSDKVHADS